MSDASVLANARRQAELEASHRDVTKPQPPPGATAESLRQVRGMSGITDEMLAERATFNLKDHMKKAPPPAPTAEVNLSVMTPEQLEALEKAAAMESKARKKRSKNA